MGLKASLVMKNSPKHPVPETGTENKIPKPPKRPEGLISRNKMKHFDNRLEHCKNRIGDFTVHHKGATKKIKYTNSNLRREFFDSYMPGVFLCNMVRKNIREYIEKNGPLPATSYYDQFYRLKKFNLPLIEQNLGMPMYGIDCDYFYFKIAFDQGYINQRTLDKALEKKEEYKQARLAAIGGLNARTWVEVYENGVKVRDEYDTEDFNIYHPFYWKIIKIATQLMEECFETFPDLCCMWLTDCVYTTVAGKAKITEFFTKKGYEHKYFAIDFIRVDYEQNRVHWFDGKAMAPKAIKFSIYDLTDQAKEVA